MPTKWRSYRDHRSCDFTSPYISNNRLISALRSSGLQSVVRSPATARTAATPTADVSTSGPNVAHTTTTLNRTVRRICRSVLLLLCVREALSVVSDCVLPPSERRMRGRGRRRERPIAQKCPWNIERSPWWASGVSVSAGAVPTRRLAAVVVGRQSAKQYVLNG